MVGIAALTPPYDGSGVGRVNRGAHPNHRPSFNASHDASLHCSMSSMPDVTRWWASLRSPHPTMEGSDFCCGSRRGSLMVMVVDGAGAQRCPPKPPTKLQCTPRAFLFRSMPSAPDVSRWWASLRSPHPTMGRCGLMVLRVARYLVVFLRECHLRLMSAAPDVSRWWASLRSPHPTMVGSDFSWGRRRGCLMVVDCGERQA